MTTKDIISYLSKNDPVIKLQTSGSVLLGNNNSVLYSFQKGDTFSSPQEVGQYFLDKYKKEGVAKGLENQLSIVQDDEIEAFADKFDLNIHVSADMLTPIFFEYFGKVAEHQPERKAEIDAFLTLAKQEFDLAFKNV